MRIIKELNLPENIALHEIKETPISEDELVHMKTLSGSFESLFSKRARMYTELGLNKKVLSESDFKKFLLQHYTFLKRPVLILDQQIFIGNASKTVEAAKKALHGK